MAEKKGVMTNIFICVLVIACLVIWFLQPFRNIGKAHDANILGELFGEFTDVSNDVRIQDAFGKKYTLEEVVASKQTSMLEEDDAQTTCILNGEMISYSMGKGELFEELSKPTAIQYDDSYILIIIPESFKQ